MALVPETKKSKHSPSENSSRAKSSAVRGALFPDQDWAGKAIVSKESLISEGAHRAAGMHPISMGQVASASPLAVETLPSGATNYVAGVSTVANGLSSAPRQDGYYRSLASAISVDAGAEDFLDSESSMLHRMKRTRFYRGARVGMRRRRRLRQRRSSD